MVLKTLLMGMSQALLIGLLLVAICLLAGCRSAVRPQTPKERPYHIQNVQIPGGARGVTLAGEFTMPRGRGPFPGVVLITGSGPQDRNQALGGHKPFLVLSDHLTRAGYAVLRYDDRGVGGSTGDYSKADLQDFADDAAAAFGWLKSVAEVDDRRIGYLGHSEGGVVAPLAAQTTDPAFLVLLAAPARPLLPDVTIAQAENLLRAQSATAAEIDAQSRQIRALTEILASSDDTQIVRRELRAWYESQGASGRQIRDALDIWGTRWGMFYASFDPRPHFAGFGGPVLALYGGADLQVPSATEAPIMNTYLAHPASQVRVVAGVNHFFQKSAGKDADDFIFIRTTIEPEVLALVTSWASGILAQTAGTRPEE